MRRLCHLLESAFASACTVSRGVCRLCLPSMTDVHQPWPQPKHGSPQDASTMGTAPTRLPPGRIPPAAAQPSRLPAPAPSAALRSAVLHSLTFGGPTPSPTALGHTPPSAALGRTSPTTAPDPTSPTTDLGRTSYYCPGPHSPPLRCRGVICRCWGVRW